jgi:hypothetical protein
VIYYSAIISNPSENLAVSFQIQNTLLGIADINSRTNRESIMNENIALQSLTFEYKKAMASPTCLNNELVSSEQLITTLCNSHNWTQKGAQVIVALANDYGAFVLRNALALAIAMDKEDGDLGL